MKKIIQTILLFYVLINQCQAQTEQDELPYDLSAFSSTPNVANIASADINGISIQTGLPNVSIPIYTIKSGQLSVPLSIYYNYNGFIPTQDASWVGLGWNLDAGGSILKVQCKGFKKTPLANLQDTFSSHYDYDEINGDTAFILNTYSRLKPINNTCDVNPHFYYYNFVGNNGKFAYYNGNPYTFPFSKIKIEKDSLRCFNITTDDGTAYYFKDLDTLYAGGLDLDGINPLAGLNVFISAFNLSKIISPDKKDTIHFYYQNVLYQENHTDTVFDFSGQATTLGKVLTSITSKYVNVFFDWGMDTSYINNIPYSSTRKDIIGRYPFLHSIRVEDAANEQPIQKTDLVFGYFGSGNKSDSLWLKLKQIKQKDIADSTIASYNFNYYGENFPFPSKSKAKVDYWGYFNDGINTTVVGAPKELVPDPINNYSNNYVGNKSPVFSKTVMGALSKITFPTGGSNNFIYESNKWNDSVLRYNYSVDTVARLNATIQPSNTSPSDTFLLELIDTQTVFISYKMRRGDTILYFNPDARYHFQYLSIKNANTGASVYSTFNTNSSGILKILLQKGRYNIIVACDSSWHIDSVQTKVYLWKNHGTLQEGVLAPGIRLQKSFAVDNLTGDTIVHTYIYQNDSGRCSGVLIPPLKKANLSGYNYTKDSSLLNFSSDTTGFYYAKKIALFQNTFDGMPKYQFFYTKVTENLVSTTDTLQTDSYFNLQPRVAQVGELSMVKKIAYRYNQDDGSYTPVTKDSSISGRKYGGDYLFYWVYPKKSSQTFYTLNGDSSQSSVSYEMNPNTHYLFKTINSNSDSSQTVTLVKHPEDYDSAISSPFLTHHVLSPVIEQQQWKLYPNGDSVLLGGSIAVYDTTLFKPIHQFALEIGQPISSLSNETKNGAGKYNSLISDIHYVNKSNLLYNLQTGRLLRFNKDAGTYQCLIWGYKDAVPIAQLVSTVADTALAYTSFEPNSNGGWLMTSTKRDTSAVTGDSSFIYSTNSDSVWRTGLNTQQTYTLSYWTTANTPLTIFPQPNTTVQGMSILGWKYFEHTLSGSNVVSVKANTNTHLDELRLYPRGGLMNTATYHPLVGATSKCDASNRITYFEYDRAGRLQSVRNQHREILKTNEYQYINQ